MVIARDATGNGNNGLYIVAGGAPPRFVPGIVPPDLALDGTNAGVQLPASFLQWDADWSVEMWTQQSDLNADGFLYDTATGAISAEDITIAYTVGSGNGSFTSITLRDGFTLAGWIADDAVPDDGNPHHIVATKEGYRDNGTLGQNFDTTVTFYVDGNVIPLTSSDTVPPATPILTTPSFGISPGTVDEYALYGYALTAGQVSAHYAARGNFAAYSASVLGDAPILYYHLDDGNPGWHIGVVAMAQ